VSKNNTGFAFVLPFPFNSANENGDFCPFFHFLSDSHHQTHINDFFLGAVFIFFPCSLLLLFFLLTSLRPSPLLGGGLPFCFIFYLRVAQCPSIALLFLAEFGTSVYSFFPSNSNYPLDHPVSVLPSGP